MLKALIWSPRDGLEGICARGALGWSLALGVIAYYWRTLPMSEALLGPIGGAVASLPANGLVALGWMALITGFIHLATRLSGHRRGRWRDILLLWGYTQIPGIALMILSLLFVVVAPHGRRHTVSLVWFGPVVALAALLFLWKLLLQYQAMRVCYGLSRGRLLGAVGLALILYNAAVWVEFTFVDDRGRVPPDAQGAMSAAVCAVVAPRIQGVLAFDRLTYLLRAPRRGEVVGFVPAGWTDSPVSVLLRARTRFLGRVVGVPGDEVEVRQGQLYRNGHPVNEPYREGRQGIDVGGTKLGGGQYLVLGDNRDMPIAAYHGGLVSERDLRGRLTAAGQLRWAYLAKASRC